MMFGTRRKTQDLVDDLDLVDLRTEVVDTLHTVRVALAVAALAAVAIAVFVAIATAGGDRETR